VARSKTPTIRGALDDLRAQGLADITAADLEVYRLVMLPATFQKLCHRLDAEVANLTRERHQAHTCPELPFGADLAGEVAASMAAERRRRWVTRPNGEPYPLTWTVHPECRLPGRCRGVSSRCGGSGAGSGSGMRSRPTRVRRGWMRGMVRAAVGRGPRNVSGLFM